MSEFDELLRRAAAGDLDAQGDVVERFYPRVRSLVHARLDKDFRQSHRWIMPLFSTRDVVHDVLADAVRKLDDTTFADEGAFVGYLATIVRNRLLDAVRYHEAARRDQRRLVRDSDTDGDISARPAGRGDGSPELAAELGEQVRILHEVLDSFGPRHKALLEMRLVDDEPFPVVAVKLGYASAESARQAFWDAKARLLVKLRARGMRGDGQTTQV